MIFRVRAFLELGELTTNGSESNPERVALQVTSGFPNQQLCDLWAISLGEELTDAGLALRDGQ
jgi:hypothetical protein